MSGRDDTLPPVTPAELARYDLHATRSETLWADAIARLRQLVEENEKLIHEIETLHLEIDALTEYEKG